MPKKGEIGRRAYNKDVQNKPPVVKMDREGFWYGENADGTIAWQESKDGKSPKALAARATHVVTKNNAPMFEVYDKSGNPIQIPYDPRMLSHHGRFWPYMEAMALEITRRVAEGEQMKKICSSEGMPPFYIVMKWIAKYPDFKAMLAEARRFRAEVFHDEIMDIKDNVDEDTSKSMKVKFDALKHLAAVNDPENFGARQKIVGDANAPVSFLFNTGINRGEPVTEAVVSTDEAEPPRELPAPDNKESE